jgi:hypothetical protein
MDHYYKGLWTEAEYGQHSDYEDFIGYLSHFMYLLICNCLFIHSFIHLLIYLSGKKNKHTREDQWRDQNKKWF